MSATTTPSNRTGKLLELAIGYCAAILIYLGVGLRVSNADYQVDLAWFVFGAAVFPIVMMVSGRVLCIAMDVCLWAADELGDKLDITVIGMSIALTATLSACASDSSLSRAPEGLEEAIDEAGIDTENPTLADLINLHDILKDFPGDEPEEDEDSQETPDEPEDEDEDEDEPLAPGELCDNTFLVWDGFAYAGVFTEVSAFPLLAFASNSSYEIAQGEPATFNLTWTAICGDIRIESTFLIVDQDISAGWNVGPYEAEVEVEMRDPVADVTFGSGASNTLSYVPGGDELHFLAYSPNANINGGTVAIAPITILEGETLTMQFRLPGEFSAFVPAGERFGFSMDIIGWTDLATGTYIRLGTIYPWGLPMGGLVAQGDEMPYMGPGTVYNVVE